MKLDDKCTKCIFIRYYDSSRSYKLFDPKEKKIIMSRDVIFKEDDYQKVEVEKDKGKNIIVEFDSCPTLINMPLNIPTQHNSSPNKARPSIFSHNILKQV